MIRKTFFVALGAAAALAACDLEVGQDDSGYATETEACRECQAILVECTSTSQDETQFVECRDQWQDCQQGRGLTKDMCRNPGDDDACQMCRGRLEECKAKTQDDETCETQFSVCKSFLITRGDIQQQCTATTNVKPEVACGVCQKDFAVCLFDLSLQHPEQVCGDKFGQCRTSNALAPEECDLPKGTKACDLCTEHHGECEASSGPSCLEGFASCAAKAAVGVTCELSSGEGGSGGESGEGGSGGSGEGGGEPTACAHDACVQGDALEDGCNSCVTQVCAADSWCCQSEWDEFCVQEAEGIPECGCTA